ncbi:hypothetical protein AUJ14_00755 [Candidatus Micrarchaeota archaeon CG1_02_55_22]|nr:MAG: hypothetical protein AUJ14_00755 [Candidatus Micrarchaeota archaeon CG1_02_55_22]
MIIERVESGPFGTNAYLVVDGCAAMVVDCPQDSAEELVKLAKLANAKIKLVAVTHGHFDHVHDVAKLKELTGAKVVVHALDAHLLESPDEYGFGFTTPSSKPDAFLVEGQVLRVGAVEFCVLHTPGHSKGSCCFYFEKEELLFSGDLLFAGGVGRTDFPESKHADLLASLKRVASLPPQTLVLPGHGFDTSVGEAVAWL